MARRGRGLARGPGGDRLGQGGTAGEEARASVSRPDRPSERTRAPWPARPVLPPRSQLAAHPSARSDAVASAVGLHHSSPLPPQARLHGADPLCPPQRSERGVRHTGPPRLLSDASEHPGTLHSWRGLRGLSRSSPYKGRRSIGTLTPGNGISLGIHLEPGLTRGSRRWRLDGSVTHRDLDGSNVRGRGVRTTAEGR